MKKSFIWAILLTIFATSCSDKKKEFAEQVAEYVKDNRVTALERVYPDADFDSIGFAGDYDKIEIHPVEGRDKFIAEFGNVASMEVAVDKDGSMTIIESHGLAAFPKEKLQIAKQTGMVKKKMSDIEIAERMSDSGFFAWLAKKSSSDNALTVVAGRTKLTSRFNSEAVDAAMPVTLTNNTNMPISGSDYSIVYTETHATCSDGSSPDVHKTRSQGGVALQPGERKTITINAIAEGLSNPRIKWNVNPSKFTSQSGYTGNEYAEYEQTQKKGGAKSGLASSGSLEQFAYLASTLLSDEDLAGYTSAELRILRNAIFARHGYIFQSADLRDYFSNFNDYSPYTSNVTDFNTTEQANVAFIKSHE